MQVQVHPSVLAREVFTKKVNELIQKLDEHRLALVGLKDEVVKLVPNARIEDIHLTAIIVQLNDANMLLETACLTLEQVAD